jgi:hypothetical protein
MAATNRAGLYLCPPPAARLAGSRHTVRQSRVRTHLRPLLRAASRAMLRLADFTMRLGLMYAGLAAAAVATALS